MPHPIRYERPHDPPVLGGVAHVFLDMRPWDAGERLFQNG